MLQKILFVLFLCYSNSTFCHSVFPETYFKEQSSCFILYDLENDKMIEHYNDERCKMAVAPNSTFKVALSVMAYDQQIINQNTVFSWDGSQQALQQWEQDQTPMSWLSSSVLWVSRLITPKLGISTIKRYLRIFDYGNQDFSGTPGKDDALTNAWLSNSLKLSPDEQFFFLRRLLKNELPVSEAAMNQTKQNMYLQMLDNNWKLYGKTGSGKDLVDQTQGWFIGWIEKDKQKYLFVTNYTDLNKSIPIMQGGKYAKQNTVKILQDSQLI